MHPLYGHKEDTNLSEGYTLIIEMVFLFLTARVFFSNTSHIFKILALHIQRGEIYLSRCGYRSEYQR